MASRNDSSSSATRIRSGGGTWRIGTRPCVAVLAALAQCLVEVGPERLAILEPRAEAEQLKGVYLEAVVGPEAEPARGSYFWHEIIGTPVTGTDGAALGTVREVYRSGGAEVFVVAGGHYGEFDVPAVRDFVRVLAPRRGEIVIDAEALDLQPPRRRGEGEPRPKAPRRRTRRPKKAITADGASELAVTELGPDATASLAAPAETPDATAGVSTADPSTPGAASAES